jgi:hypothetical protein
MFATTDGSNYEDSLDACQTGTPSADAPGSPPAGMSVLSPIPNDTPAHGTGEES